MYLICDKDNSECPTLYHGMEVFQNARLCGAKRIHVLNHDGEDYDLLYVKNSDCLPDFIKNRWKNQSCYPDYLSYSTTQRSSLYLDFFRVFQTVCLQTANEYTIALADVILRYTDLALYSLDKRIYWFFGDRIPIVKEGEIHRGKDVLIVGDISTDRNFDVSFHYIGPVNAFHNVFFLQGQGVTSLDKYSYAELVIDEGAGIGSVLNNLYRFKKALSQIGLVPVVRGEKIGHFNVSFLEKYFNLHLKEPSAEDENTVFFPEMSSLSATMFLDWIKPEQNLSMLRSSFLSELTEYADAVFGQKRFLGVLIRGTDYLIVHKDGPRKMASANEIIPMIHEWISTYCYDGIFLATEDIDILSRIRQEFGSLVKVIAQERHSVNELYGHKLLSELEKDNASDYDQSVAESTINYFYALYMLSRCAAFICSGPCNGYDLATGFNEGKYERTYLFKNSSGS